MLYKKFKTILPNFFKFHAKNLLRLLDVALMMLCLHFYPDSTHKFSTRKFLPSKKYRLKREKFKNIPYSLIKEKSNFSLNFDEVNAIGIGSSFNLNKIKEINKPTFLLSFWDSLKIDQYENLSYFTENSFFAHNKNYIKQNIYKEYNNSNLIYVASHYDVIKKLADKGHKVLVVNSYTKGEDNNIISPGNYDYENKNFLKLINSTSVSRISLLDEIFDYPLDKTYPNWTQTGSIVPYLAAISFISKKINVYGWDFFLNKSPNEMNYYELFFKMYSNKADLKRSRSHFEEAIFNFYFGNLFSKNKKFEIKSYMGQLNSQTRLLKKIEKVVLH